ncbi:beta-lactamase family protein [bacterium]|nr:beta-lactamase family protein [bacterium]
MKTNIFNIRLLLGVLSSLLVFQSCIDLVPLRDNVQEEMDHAVDGDFDGMIVYLNRNGKSKFYSAGFNNREKLTPADPHSLFRIASISKLYIAAATAKMVAAGQLNLDQKLVELIPEVEGRIENADRISLKMMIGHRSGIPEFIYHPDFESGNNLSYMENASLIFDESADFEPDKKYSYSNTNYLLIGEILDRTLGYSHHQYIKNTILLPMGLTNTYSLYSEVDSNRLMSGYLKGYDQDVKSWDHVLPGGSMIATAEDVGLFLRYMIDGSLFSQEEQDIYSSIYKYEHTGWVNGYCSIVNYHEDSDAVVVQFVNTSGKEIFWLKLNRVYDRIVRLIEKENEN